MTEIELGEALRPQFPIFERRFDGHAPVLLDGPAGSQVPRAVIDSVAGYLAYHNANTHGAFATSAESDAIIAAARAAVADFLGAASPAEIAFGANMTTLTFALSRALGANWGAGDEVVVTDLDHQANVAPWRRMAADRGMVVRTVPFDPATLQLDYAALETLLSPRTRLVAVGAASNAVGTLNDVARVAAAAHRAGALCFVDAVHYAPHRLPDVAAMGCDFLACSAYKFFGPHVGILWGRRELLESVTAYKVPPAPDAGGERWETGTQNLEGIAGAGAAVEWIARLAGPAENEAATDRRAALTRAFDAIAAYEDALLAELLAGLTRIAAVRVYGPPPGSPRTPTLGFTVAGHHADAVAQALAREAIFVWSGHFYATTVTATLGLDDAGGLIRIGLAPYNTPHDVARLLDAVQRLASG